MGKFRRNITSSKDLICNNIICDNISTTIPNYVTINGTQTITNKTISGSDNTISNIQDSALSSNIPKLNEANIFSSSGNSFSGITEFLVLKSNGNDANNCSFLTNQGSEWLKCNNTTNITTFPLAHVNFIGNPRINDVELQNVTETLTNKTISGSNNTITNIQNSALPSNIICNSIQNGATGDVRFNFKNDSGVNMMYFINGGSDALTGSNYDFNIPTSYNFMINQVPITETTETLSNKTLDNSCIVQNISLQYPQAKISTNNIRAPINTDDQSAGNNYTQGSIWVDGLASPHQIYFCTDSTVDNAVWQKMILSTDILTNTINSTNSINTTSNITGANFVTSGCSLGSSGLSNVVGDIVINPELNLNIQSDLEINGTRILTDQQSAISNSTGGDESSKINLILTALRNHGIIAT